MPDFNNVLSGINTALGVVGGTASGIFGANQAKKNRALQWKMFNAQNAFNAQQSQLNFERNRDEWTRQFNLQNEYNDPSAQMQRYLNAGINPYQATGLFGNAQNASGGNGSAASAGSFSGANYYPNNPAQDFFSGIQQSMQSNLAILDATKQGATMQGDINATNANNLLDSELFGMRKETMQSLMQSQQAQQSYQTAYYALKIKNVPDEVANELAQLTARTSILKNMIEQSNYDAKTAKSQWELLDRTFHYQAEGIIAQVAKTKAETDSILGMLDISHDLAENTIKKTDQEIRESDQRIKTMLASIAIQRYLARKQGALFDSQAYNLDLQSTLGFTLDSQQKRSIIRGLDLDNLNKEDRNKVWLMLNTPNPYQWANYMAMFGGSTSAALPYGLAGASSAWNGVVAPWANSASSLGFTHKRR